MNQCNGHKKKNEQNLPSRVKAFYLNSATRRQEYFLCSDLDSKSLMLSKRADQCSFTLAWGNNGKVEDGKSETENSMYTTATQDSDSVAIPSQNQGSLDKLHLHFPEQNFLTQGDRDQDL